MKVINLMTHGQEICIPEYLTGVNYDFSLGDTYFHEKLGVIQLKNGLWKDKIGKTINPN